MADLTMDLAEVQDDFAGVAAQVAATGVSVTVFRKGRPWVVVRPAETDGAGSAESLAAALMDEYEDVFGSLR